MKKVLMIPSCGDVAYMLERLDKGMYLWRQGQYDIMILSGGIAEYPYPRFPGQTYGDKMYEWVMSQHGHPEEKEIIREHNSRDTYENIFLSLAILRRNIGYGALSVTVVTQKQHGKRFLYTFQRAHGIKDVQIEQTSYKLPFHSWLLEWVFIATHYLDPKGTWLLGPLNRRIRSKWPTG